MIIKKFSFSVILSGMVLLLSQTGLYGQGILESVNEIESQKTDTTNEDIQPFPVGEIVNSLNQTYTLVNKAVEFIFTEDQKKDIIVTVDSLVIEAQLFLSDSLSNNLSEVSLRELDNLNYQLKYYSGEVSKLQDNLMSRSYQINKDLGNLTLNKKRWELTLKSLHGEERSETIVERIQNTIDDVDSVQKVFQDDFDFLFNNQTRLSDVITSLDRMAERLSEKEKKLAETLFVIDMPGLIKDLTALNQSDLFRNHFNNIKSNFEEDFRLFKREYLTRVLILLIIFLGVYILTRWSKKYYTTKDTDTWSKFTPFGQLLIESPFLTSLFLATLFIRLIYPELPQMVRVINLLLLMIPVIYFLIRMYYKYLRTILNLLLLNYIFSFLFEFIFYPDIIVRIVLLGFSISGILFFALVFRNKPLSGVIKNKIIYNFWRILIFSFIIFEFVGILGNFSGAFSMAEYFTYTPIHTLILGITVFVSTKVAETLIPIILKSDLLQELNIVREDFDNINKKLNRLIKFLLWILFIVLALKFFRIQEPILDWGDKILNNGWKIGAIDFTPMRLITFIFIIWLSIMISRILGEILEKDVFERVKVSRGIPSTITMILKIVLITGGFLLAAAAAGLELTNLSIILGAFSVGIGFGLQNIFNNMVSGLILAFERPIKVGDTVQVDQLLGVVKKIGLRSSTVKSFDGAEVIVPNGNLISNQMINWTLSDFSRRMDIRVGVAYGTDPEKVLDILLSVAGEHEKVYKAPKPRAFFIGFGDSSLDFRLLAWVNIENRLETESEINVQINKKLAEASIEIPFPQRDLHIRSDDTIKNEIPTGKDQKNNGKENT